MKKDIESHPYYYYYTLNNQKFSTKLFALYEKEKYEYLNQSIIWHFPKFENALSKIDITIEPNETLQELYLQRAIHLRNKYDYLKLYYSGGNDSNQILEIFMLNNIFLDEIVIFSKEDNTLKNRIKNENDLLIFVPEYYEASRSALPQAKFYVETYSPKTKITIIENIYNNNRQYWENLNFKNIQRYLMSCNLGLDSRIVTRSRDLNFIDSSLSKISKTHNVGHIYGKEKARVSNDQVGFYISVVDADVIDYIDLQWLISETDVPNNMELFYIHPDFVKIQVKQAHEIIKKMSAYLLGFKTKSNNFGSRSIEDLFSKVLYVRKHERIYTGLKTGDSYHYLANMLEKKENYFYSVDELIKKQRGELAINYYLKDKALDNYNKFLHIIQSNLFLNKNKKQVNDLFFNSYSTKKYYVKYF